MMTVMRWWRHFAISRTNRGTEQPKNPQSDSIFPSAGPRERRKKGYFCWLVMMTVMTVMIMVIMMVASIMIERNFHSGALLFEKKVIFAIFWKRVTDRPTDGRTDGPTDRPTDRRTDGRTDGRTDRPTDRPTNGRTNPLIEMRGRI